jgi:hypothetical protein
MEREGTLPFLPLRPLYVFSAYLLHTGASINVDLRKQANKIYKISFYTTVVLLCAPSVTSRTYTPEDCPIGMKYVA